MAKCCSVQVSTPVRSAPLRSRWRGHMFLEVIFCTALVVEFALSPRGGSVEAQQLEQEVRTVRCSPVQEPAHFDCYLRLGAQLVLNLEVDV